MGWGTHEKGLPADGARHEFGCDAAIYLNRPGLVTRVRTWTPIEGPFHGFIITHNESISIADYFTLRDGNRIAYRPTVHYAYHPCDQAIMPYLGPVVGKYSDWTPLKGRDGLFPEDLDRTDPWQFKNFRVS